MPQNLESTHRFPEIGAPAQRTLVNAGYTHLEELANVSETDLLKLHGMGPKAVGLLREAFEELGLSFPHRATGGSHVRTALTSTTRV